VSHLPPALARRIDRLARRAHSFHRWAHHPLCSRYAPEVVRLGHRTRACLGCSLAAAGVLAGGALGLALPLAPWPWLAAAALLLLAAVPLAIPSGRRAPAAPAAPRSPARKLATRLAPGLLAGALLLQGLSAPASPRLGAAALAAAALAWATVRYRRQGPDRSACLGCPEAPPGSRCSGFAPIVRRERAMERLAGRWIAASGTGRPPGA
jgi:hypothetical protein